MSGRAVEAAGDVDTLLLDKTGTITLGNRMATELHPAAGVRIEELADAAQLASLADETPEGRSIVVAGQGAASQLRGRDVASSARTFVPFTRADAHERLRPRTGAPIRKGAVDAVARARRRRWAAAVPHELEQIAEPHRRRRRHAAGGRPTARACSGIIHLKDIVKGGIAERFARFRAMGIRTVMITGDNPRTAAAIAKEAGVDDFLAEATPEAKMRSSRTSRPRASWWR